MVSAAIETGGKDTRGMLAEKPLTLRQMRAIAVCVTLNALDGFDVLSISFAAPGISREWGIDRAALGVVLSMELIGMAIGSVLLGQMADRIGRRATAIGCLLVMALGMLSTTQANSIGELAATRLFTGLGIGGMLATTNALVAEYSNDRWRKMAVTIMALGYPIGAIVGGAIAGVLLETGGWRQIFWLGAFMAGVILPFVLLFLPETVDFRLSKRRSDTLARVNHSLTILGHVPVTRLPSPEPRQWKPRFSGLFKHGLAPVTLLLTGAYFLHMLTFYFLLKWIPKLVADLGFSASAAGGVLVWANIGGLLGGIVFSGLCLRFSVRALLVAAMIASAAMVGAFGQTSGSLLQLSVLAAAGGFCTNAAMAGLYVFMAISFPTSVRAGATGFAIGVGRGGAALGPVLAGFLFQRGMELPLVAMVMGSGSLLAALAVLALRWTRVGRIAQP